MSVLDHAPRRLALTLGLALAVYTAGADEGPREDAALSAFIAEALQARPELAQARAGVQAAREGVPQAQALADPVLQIGVQNEGFSSWQVGKREASWVLFMASQTFPFPGKRSLRGEIANTQVTLRELSNQRLRLATVAEVRRAYLSLQLARARLELLQTLKALIAQAVAAATSRYETGEGVQSDVLRARLLARIAQRRVIVEAEERHQTQTLNRLRGKRINQPIEPAYPFTQLTFPPPPDEAEALNQLRTQSPEYLAARTEVVRAERTRALEQRSYFPDLSVGAGVMVRGGLEPMWTATLGMPLPVFAQVKQARAVAEAGAMLDSAGEGVEAVEQVLQLRTCQRLEYWRALREVWRSNQGGLLADAQATADSTLMQYRVGKVPFTSVLEANTASIGAVDASLGVLADAWRLAIAQDELSLAEPLLGAASATGM